MAVLILTEMKSGTRKSMLASGMLLFLCSFEALAATPLPGSSPLGSFPMGAVKMSGSIAGIVRDNTGIPQMGATVFLFNRYERMVQRAFTNERGAFGFDTLAPDLYAVRVNLASFVPALKQKIAVQPGMQSLLYINLATLLSSIELVYVLPGQGAMMSDDWKWTLKSSASTRPILRVLPQVSISDPRPPQRTMGAIFSDTRGLFEVSAGDNGSIDGSIDDPTWQPDLGTTFALATSLFGNNQLQVSGNVGHATRSGIPAASFRTSYRHEGQGPEISVTLRQVFLPTRSGLIGSGQQDGLPALRTLSVGMIDRLELTGDLHLEYGMSLDSVTFFDRVNYFSPFARLTYEAGAPGTVRAAYSSGAPPAELFSRSGEAEGGLHQDLNALSMVPRISLRENRIRVQRTQTMEIGLEKKINGLTANLTGYRETVSNGALTMSADDDFAPTGDVLPSFASRASTFNTGTFERYGYAAGVTQSLGDKVEVGASTGRSGVLVADSTPLESGAASDIRSKIHTGQRYWAVVRVSATLPVLGTQISSSYQWIDSNALLPSHLYLTQRAYADSGWNIHIRQPIRSFPGAAGRLEATADLRNLLAEGYLSLPSNDSRRVLLMQSPRAIRGGLSFIF